MRHFTPLYLLISCLASLAADGQTISRPGVDTSLYVILSYNKRIDFAMGLRLDHPKATSLSPAEVDSMEILVDSAYRSFNSNNPRSQLMKPLSTYRRHYVAIINGKGQKEVWVDCFCGSYEGWRQDVEIVDDGGACFFELWINLTEKKIERLIPGGSA